MNIVQFSPYYKPHVGGVENVVLDIHTHWAFGKSVVFTSDIGQEGDLGDESIICYPAFHLVSNFPLPKFWQKDFWDIFRNTPPSVAPLTGEGSNETIIITHTRFFFSSFMGAFIAKKNNIQHIHIEHGSGFVKSGNIIVDVCSKIYDKTFGKYCIGNAKRVLGISNASVDFIKKEFSKEDVDIWYRGMNFPLSTTERKSGEIIFVYIGRLVALKQVEDFIDAYERGGFKEKAYIIGDGVLKNKLEEQASGLNIDFLGKKSPEEIIDFLQSKKCILVNPSSQEGLPTTVIEGLMTKNLVIATDVGGTSEISQSRDLQLYRVGDRDILVRHMKKGLENFDLFSGESYADVSEKFAMKNSIENLYNFLK